MNTTTLQQTDNKQTVNLQEPVLPPSLPQVFSDVKRVKGGYKVFNEVKWTFYAASCLNEAEIADLEEWLEEVAPV